MDIADLAQTIARVGFKIKEMLDTIDENNQECDEIVTRAKRLAPVLTLLKDACLSNAQLSEQIEKPINDLDGALTRALVVVKTTKDKKIMCHFITAGDTSKQLRTVSNKIMEFMQLATFCCISTLAVTGSHPPKSKVLGMMRSFDTTTGSIYETRSEVTGEEDSFSKVSLEPALSRLKKFSLSELEAATDGFSQQHVIGEGESATIYKAILIPDKTIVAVRRFSVNLWKTQPVKHYILVFSVLLHHDNVVAFLGYCNETKMEIIQNKGDCVFSNRHDMFMVEEFLTNGNLYNIIHGSSSMELNWSSRFEIIRGIAQGVAHMHRKGVVHLDLMPANILLDSHINPKIHGFERCRKLPSIDDTAYEPVTDEFHGTLGYLPPEYVADGIISSKHDVFSFGVLLQRLIIKPEHWQYSTDWLQHAVESGDVNDYLLDRAASNSQEREEMRRCMKIGLLCASFERMNRPTMEKVIKMLEGNEQIPTPNRKEQEVSKLDVHPFELRFSCEPNKTITCPLYLTNSTDEFVVFRVMKNSSKCFVEVPRYGIVPPRSNCTLHLESKDPKKQAEQTSCALILDSYSVSRAPTERPSQCDIIFKEVKKTARRCAVSALQGKRTSDSLLKPTDSGPLKVVIVYAFDCTISTPAWYTVDSGVYWLVHGKLAHLEKSSLGYVYVMSAPNTCTSDMKLVDLADTQASGYKKSRHWRRTACTKNMACGLYEAHRLISYSGQNGIILLFSDGSNNTGDFFDGAQDFVSSVPVHTFTLGGEANNRDLRAIAEKSPGGTFNIEPVPGRPNLSAPFSQLLNRFLGCTTTDVDKPLRTSSGREQLNVVIIYAFDCTTSTPNWCTVDSVFWLVHDKLTHFVDSYLGYLYVMSTANTCTSDMKLVDPSETHATGYKESSAWRRTACTKNMASGLTEAHKMISDCGQQNNIILLFSDGLINKGDFFDGAEEFVSQVPVHTFTLGGDSYDHGLRAIAKKSPGGKFNPAPVPDRPNLSAPFSQLLDSILGCSMNVVEKPLSSCSVRGALDVVIVYAFDCTTSTPAWFTVDGVFWLVHEKLTHFTESYLGYVYVMSTPNTFTSNMKLVDSTETPETNYKGSSAWRRAACAKNMASGLTEAHKLISYRQQSNSIILFFSDGLINKGDYFDGAESFISKVPVHTFTLGGESYNHGLRAIAENSPGGTFHPLQVPDRPDQSESFSQLLDDILRDTMDTMKD